MGAGDRTDPFLNPEFLDFLIFIKSPIIYILKNPLLDSIKGGKNMVEFGPIQMIAMGFPIWKISMVHYSRRSSN